MRLASVMQFSAFSIAGMECWISEWECLFVNRFPKLRDRTGPLPFTYIREEFLEGKVRVFAVAIGLREPTTKWLMHIYGQYMRNIDIFQ
ncbi:hypothetical protein HYZ98_02295 [Candidatus Peregrinibacteria bacterium]|nr:hypothetical protein [Candidatus Peregrinibacteria bacterium]